MILSFGNFELDSDRAELRHDGEPVAMEGRVFALLSHLLQNNDRLITKDELLDVVWDGRIISDSAVSSAVKDARKAVGDNGSRQEIIRTVHGRGFRCACEVRVTARTPVAVTEIAAPEDTRFRLAANDGKPSIAILPFQCFQPETTSGALADAIPAELISALSRLRWLDVVARGSSFRFRDAAHDPARLRQVLGVQYFLSGLVETSGNQLIVTVELVGTADGVTIWGNSYRGTIDDIYEIRTEIGSSVIAALELHIPEHEARRARFVSAKTLDAWSLYHLGLQHMYRFNKPNNEKAAGFFRMAITKEPDLARAHAGLSFTHFQTAFLEYGSGRASAVDAAKAAAEHSLELDSLDPFANYAMGRVCWLNGDLDGAGAWLDRSVEISPNYAQAIYVRSLMDVLAGEAQSARENSARSMALSPLDPLHYAMMGSHAQSYLIEKNFEEAAAWADRAARAPGAHHLLSCIAAIVNQAAGNTEKAQYWATSVRERRPDMSASAFFNAFPFAEGETRAIVARALADMGF